MSLGVDVSLIRIAQIAMTYHQLVGVVVSRLYKCNTKGVCSVA